MQADLRSRLYGSASRPTLATGGSSTSGTTTVDGGRALQHRPMLGPGAAGSRRKKGGHREPKQASQRAAAASLLRGKRGALSTTGMSTNYVVAIELPTEKKPTAWTLCGTAFLLNLDD